MDLMQEVKKNPKYNPKNSWLWFSNNVRKFATSKGMKPFDMFDQDGVKLTDSISIGGMFAFFYDPKTKDTLPYYDKFPLIIPFSAHGKYFTGLNVHYLNLKARYALFSKLLDFASNDRFDEKTKLSLSWKLISNFSKFPEVQPCVKQYISGQVKSKFMQIHPDNWVITLALPTERWAKGSNDKVWADSNKTIRG